MSSSFHYHHRRSLHFVIERSQLTQETTKYYSSPPREKIGANKKRSYVSNKQNVIKKKWKTNSIIISNTRISNKKEGKARRKKSRCQETRTRARMKRISRLVGWGSGDNISPTRTAFHIQKCKFVWVFFLIFLFWNVDKEKRHLHGANKSAECKGKKLSMKIYSPQNV